ncbi:glyoxylate reductase/hydroxypyruvate reductase-like isoform X2 [Homalodisca vitripennis]|nr:glyoxylate reductase/hydroxypyruvate reductase-like isoform X2 [Homalodisca vitripennis]
MKSVGVRMQIMLRPKILISHPATPQKALDVLKDKFELVVSQGDPNPTREQLLKDIKGCAGVLLFGHSKFDKEMMDAAGDSLKVVGSAAAGYDHIDLPLLRERGVQVSNTPGLLGPAVAELSIALLLEVSRRTLEGYRAIVENKWIPGHPTWMTGPGLSGKTVGIIGLGANGFNIAKRIKGFDIGRLLYNDLSELKEKAKQVDGEFVTKDVLFRESDFVFLGVPLTNLTKNLVNKEVFKTMKNSSILINTARGEVVNQDDLVEALQKNIIYGAGLDVMYPEPLPSDHILTKLPNCVLTPHIGSATIEIREAMLVLAAQNILNVLTGQPLLTPIP